MIPKHSPVLPDRRTMLRGAAWSVPAVALAGTAPAFATSPPGGTTPTIPAGQLRIAADTSGSAAFAGSRVADGGDNHVRIDRLKVRNDGPDALPAGALAVSVTIPEAWGTIVGLSKSFPFPSERLAFAFSGRTATFTALPGFGGMIVGEDIDFTSPTSGTGVVALAFDITGDAWGTDLPIQASVSTISTTAQNNFIGETITDTTTGDVWSW